MVEQRTGPHRAASYPQATGSSAQHDLNFITSTSDLSSVSVSGGDYALSGSSVDKTGDTTSDDDSSFEPTARSAARPTGWPVGEC